MVVDYNTTVTELRYAKRWIGRLVGKAIPWFVRVLRKLGKRELANTLVMGVVYQPLRGWSRFSQGGLRMSQLDGLIMMFNGIPVCSCILGRSKKIPDHIKDARICCGIGTRRTTDGALVDTDHLIQLIRSIDPVMPSGNRPCSV